MRKLQITLILCFFSLIVFSQKVSPQMKALEDKILTEKTDLTALELITQHNEARDGIYNFRTDIINSYDENLSVQKKARKFRKEYINNEDYRALREAEKKAKEEKIAYLRTMLPSRVGANGAKQGKKVTKFKK